MYNKCSVTELTGLTDMEHGHPKDQNWRSFKEGELDRVIKPERSLGGIELYLGP